MAVTGWKYLKMGQCSCCNEAGARLYVPVLEGTPIEKSELVTGEHIPHFNPVCKRCQDSYSLDIICSVHRLPLRASLGLCDLCCRPTKKGRYTPTES